MVVATFCGKLAGTTGTGNDGTDGMTVFCEPNTNSLDRVSLGFSSVACLLLETTAVAAVTGLLCGMEAPNLNPDRAGVETILVDAEKSFSFVVLEGLAPNENVAATGQKTY